MKIAQLGNAPRILPRVLGWGATGAVIGGVPAALQGYAEPMWGSRGRSAAIEGGIGATLGGVTGGLFGVDDYIRAKNNWHAAQQAHRAEEAYQRARQSYGGTGNKRQQQYEDAWEDVFGGAKRKQRDQHYRQRAEDAWKETYNRNKQQSSRRPSTDRDPADDYHRQQQARQAYSGNRVKDVAPWAHGATTKAEVKRRWRDLAFKHHPDRGGDPRIMQKINEEYQKLQNHPDFLKMSSFRGKFAAYQVYGLI